MAFDIFFNFQAHSTANTNTVLLKMFNTISNERAKIDANPQNMNTHIRWDVFFFLCAW